MTVAFVTAAIATGGGRHSNTLSQSQVELVSVLILVGLTMVALSFTLTKVAVVILLIKLLRPSPWHTRVLLGLVSGNVLLMVAAGLVLFLQCIPPRALWIQEIEHRCWDPMVATSLATSASGKTCPRLVRSPMWCPVCRLTTTCFGFVLAFSALSDFYLAVYPATVLWSLDMNWRKKLTLSIALGFGAWCVTLSSIPPSPAWVSADK
jgi:hypothetical protein